MSAVTNEQPCYTLINLSQDFEQPSEMKLREDLEKGDNRVIEKNIFPVFLNKNFMIKIIFKDESRSA